MKKTCFILITLIAFLFIMSGVQNVYAIDLNLINSVRENEINTAENLSVNTNAYNTTDIDSNSNFEDEDTAINDDNTIPTTNVSNVTNTTDGTLTIENILNILLVVVGVLLILLGIAIMIRMNR